MGIGIEAEHGCTEGLEKTTTLRVSTDDIDSNSTLKAYDVFAVDNDKNETTLIGEKNWLTQI